jgi:hypothetical protein
MGSPGGGDHRMDSTSTISAATLVPGEGIYFEFDKSGSSNPANHFLVIEGWYKNPEQ